MNGVLVTYPNGCEANNHVTNFCPTLICFANLVFLVRERYMLIFLQRFAFICNVFSCSSHQNDTSRHRSETVFCQWSKFRCHFLESKSHFHLNRMVMPVM